MVRVTRRFTAHRHELSGSWYVFDHLRDCVYVKGYESERAAWECARSLEKAWERVRVGFIAGEGCVAC